MLSATLSLGATDLFSSSSFFCTAFAHSLTAFLANAVFADSPAFKSFSIRVGE
jgi:hypothetical protein